MIRQIVRQKSQVPKDDLDESFDSGGSKILYLTGLNYVVFINLIQSTKNNSKI